DLRRRRGSALRPGHRAQAPHRPRPAPPSDPDGLSVAGPGPGDRTPSVDGTHRRPDGATDAEIEAAGTVGEAMEYIERARGHLYDLHQLIGRADILFQEAADQLDDAGRSELAARIREEMVGVNVLHGRWTFQIVEEFDDGFWS